ncbi:MAG: restriction endonuclease subunit S, partial [Clostridia bacterium]|nr:restriction endonuclease subunit S [Clostridia bacterium]
MKNSGIEWIGEIPDGWRICKVKNIFLNRKRVVGEQVDDYARLALTLNGVIKRSKEDSEGLQTEHFEGYQILEKGELVFKLIDL